MQPSSLFRPLRIAHLAGAAPLTWYSRCKSDSNQRRRHVWAVLATVNSVIRLFSSERCFSSFLLVNFSNCSWV